MVGVRGERRASPRWGAGGIVAAVLLLIGLVGVGGDVVAQPATQDPRARLDQAIDDFAAGRLEAAVAGFDAVAALVPAAAPQLWQRGIALYYVGRYGDCRRMFESHRTVNPNDVENAAWHFLCVARQESPEAARAALLPVGPDGRAPMTEIYRMFRGELTPDDVIAAGTRARGAAQTRALFYAHLYVGLYHEAVGDDVQARDHLEEAAADAYARVGGYMHMVARVHVAQLDGGGTGR